MKMLYDNALKTYVCPDTVNLLDSVSTFVYVPPRKNQSESGSKIYSTSDLDIQLLDIFEEFIFPDYTFVNFVESDYTEPSLKTIICNPEDWEDKQFIISNSNYRLNFMSDEIDPDFLPKFAEASRFSYPHISEAKLKQILVSDYDADFLKLTQTEDSDYEISMAEIIENWYCSPEEQKEASLAHARKKAWELEFPNTHNMYADEINDEYADIMREYNSFESDEYNIGSHIKSKQVSRKKNSELTEKEIELKRMYKNPMQQRLRAKNRAKSVRAKLSDKNLTQEEINEIYSRKVTLTEHIAFTPEDFKNFEEWNDYVLGEIELYKTEEKRPRSTYILPKIAESELLTILDSPNDDAPRLTRIWESVDWSVLDEPEERRARMMARINARAERALVEELGPYDLEARFDEIDETYGVLTSKKEKGSFFKDFQETVLSMAIA